MAAYLQMGHDSENLVGAEDLDEFRGIILSPVNRNETELQGHISRFRLGGTFEIVLDPQLYYPGNSKGALSSYAYFPRNENSPVDWVTVCREICLLAPRLGVDTVCSPALIPAQWTDEYFQQVLDNARMLAAETHTLLTIAVPLLALRDMNFILRLTSIFTQFEGGFYLVIVSDVDPRREIADALGLGGLLYLISLLAKGNREVVVSHCSSDMVLYKAAGASHCATGKFFNLRRFSKARFEETSAGGGGQLPYRFEHSLLGFLRQADVLRLRARNFSTLIGAGFSQNHWSSEIDALAATRPEAAWLAMAWKQYLSWFGKVENFLSGEDSRIIVREWLRTAEENWSMLNDAEVLLDENANNGAWIRPWRQALSDFSAMGID